MRIAVSGTQCIGKSTFISDFLKRWPMYKSPGSSCSKFVTENKLNHSKESSEETQQKLLDYLTDNVMKHEKKDCVIYDRCPIDNLAYTMWLNAKGKISDKFVDKTINIVRESTRFLDIIFFIPITKVSPVEIVSNDVREVDEIFREEIDNIFKGIVNTYHKRTGAVFIKDDSPAIIEIFGKPEQRIALASMYINERGDMYGEDESLIQLPADFSVEDFA
jgi:predicted ATPase